MAECPFCKGSVSEDLASSGGRCPHCLIEIPGDEAPTNPGQDAQARLAAEVAAAKAGGQRRTAFALAALLFLVVVGAGSAWILRPPPPDTSGANNFDDFVMVPLDRHQDLAIAQAEAEEAVQPSGGNGGSRASNGGSRRSNGSAGGNGISAGVAAAATGTGGAEEAQSASILGTGVKSSAGPSIGLELGTGPTTSVASKGPESIVLTETDAIREMVQAVLKTGGSALKACYDSELKGDDALKGTWEISFSLNRTGKAQAIEIAALGGSNPALEACMQKKVAAWSFLPIANPIRIVKNFSFKSGW